MVGATRSLREERAMPMMRTPEGRFLGFADTWHLTHYPEVEQFQDFRQGVKP